MLENEICGGGFADAELGVHEALRVHPGAAAAGGGRALNLCAERDAIGFGMELAARVAPLLGMTLEIIRMDFGARIPALAGGESDMIGAYVAVMPERAA